MIESNGAMGGWTHVGPRIQATSQDEVALHGAVEDVAAGFLELGFSDCGCVQVAIPEQPPGRRVLLSPCGRATVEVGFLYGTVAIMLVTAFPSGSVVITEYALRRETIEARSLATLAEPLQRRAVVAATYWHHLLVGPFRLAAGDQPAVGLRVVEVESIKPPELWEQHQALLHGHPARPAPSMSLQDHVRAVARRAAIAGHRGRVLCTLATVGSIVWALSVVSVGYGLTRGGWGLFGGGDASCGGRRRARRLLDGRPVRRTVACRQTAMAKARTEQRLGAPRIPSRQMRRKWDLTELVRRCVNWDWYVRVHSLVEFRGKRCVFGRLGPGQPSALAGVDPR